MWGGWGGGGVEGVAGEVGEDVVEGGAAEGDAFDVVGVIATEGGDDVVSIAVFEADGVIDLCGDSVGVGPGCEEVGDGLAELSLGVLIEVRRGLDGDDVATNALDEVGGCVVSDELATVEDGELVAIFCGVEFVGGHGDGGAELIAKCFEDLPEFSAGGGIEAVGGFVHQ